jgi:hypothetical protein
MRMPAILSRACRALRRFIEARAGMPELVPPAQPASSPQPPQPPLDPFEFDFDAADRQPTPQLVDREQQSAPPLPARVKPTNPGSQRARKKSSRPPPSGSDV